LANQKNETGAEQMKATITINLDNAAFDGRKASECARLLRVLANTLDENTVQFCDGRKLIDANGNTCGAFKLSGKGA
jgi:hypothetical protein